MGAVAWRVESVHEVASTNTLVGGRAQQGEPEGLVVRADHQTHGRGRLDRRWEAPAGTALLCSLLLRPNLDLDDLHWVVAGVALGLRDAVRDLTGSEPDLKWPNDLLFGESKFAGILAEVEATHDGTALIVGVGVNLSAHPPGATDLLTATGHAVGASALLEAMLAALEPWRELWQEPAGRLALRELYEGALVTSGQMVRVVHGAGETVGRARGVDEAGRLVVEGPEGDQVFASGDVVHVRPAPEGQ